MTSKLDTHVQVISITCASMNQLSRICIGLGFGVALCFSPFFCRSEEIAQSAGSIPVLHEVDVVVVGGGSGGVAAAAEAARAGAKVFLAAPRPYLGEDICATYRLWLEPGEEPATELAREVFKPAKNAPSSISPVLPAKYSATPASSPKHRDTKPETLLTDGKWSNASRESVQYDADVVLAFDLEREQEIRGVHVMAYQRAGDFEAGQVLVSGSPDNQNWSPLGAITNAQQTRGILEDAAQVISMEVSAKARYLRLEIKRAPGANRLLLGEVVIQGAEPERAKDLPKPALFTTPMQVKRSLDQALIKAGVPFLYWCYATELLRDSAGKIAGVVISTRSGRQAVTAKVIIDATDRSTVARMAGASFTPYPSGVAKFRRVVVGGAARTGEGLRVVPGTQVLQITDPAGQIHPVHHYELEIAMPNGSFAAFAEAEQIARDRTWTPEAVDGAEVLFQVPPDQFKGRKSYAGSWQGADEISVECFQPVNEERIFALGGCADVSREAAASLVRPVNQIAVGERIGRAAAALASAQQKPESPKVAGQAVKSKRTGTIGEVAIEQNHRVDQRRIPENSYGVPVIGEYDVIVVGGGTGGAPAGIGAGRAGARTLVIEYLHGLGGVGTLGYIASYYHGNRVGFSTEIDKGVDGFGEKGRQGTWNPEHKSEWLRQELRKTKVDLWYGVLGQGAVIDGKRVTGVVVLTPAGRGVVLAKMVIDSTGNADIAAAGGAVCRYTDESDVAVQGTGLPPRELGQKYTNTDYTFVDDTDVFDIWRVLVTAKAKFKNSYDMGQLIDTRERRQIQGDFFFSPMDMMLGRTFPDTIVVARSNFDTHGYIVHPMFMIRPPGRDDINVRVPWRCLLPRGLEGVIVTGLGVSAHRDAIPCIRMQPDVQNQGYAAGLGAAMIAKQGCGSRDLNIRDLQKQLVEIGNLPESVLQEKDSFPLPKEKVAEAVQRVANDYEGLEIVLSHFDIAQPMLRQALVTAPEKDRLVYAHILGMMGDGAGAAELAKAVGTTNWDAGWRYTGMGQFGRSMSPLDSLIIALGRTKSTTALKPILEKVGQLGTDSEFSHFRAVTMALETLGNKAAAEPLAQLLQKPGMGGHAVSTIEEALESNPPSGTDNTVRNQALSELYLARALYRCGDYEGLGEKTLLQYSKDLHGHYARHAKAVLKKTPRPIE